MKLTDDGMGHGGPVIDCRDVERQSKEIRNGKTADAQPQICRKTFVKTESEILYSPTAQKFIKNPGEH